MRKWLGTFALILLILQQIGCPSKQLRPPRPPEECTEPPAVQRYTAPPQPPASAMQDDDKNPNSPGTPGLNSKNKFGSTGVGGM